MPSIVDVCVCVGACASQRFAADTSKAKGSRRGRGGREIYHYSCERLSVRRSACRDKTDRRG